MANGLKGKRVLVIEDEYFTAADLSRAFVAAGAEVVGPSGDLKAGLALIEDASIDAAVLDVNLEGAYSYVIADTLAQRAVPFLFVTGYDDWSLPEQYRDAPRLAKPFQIQTVIERVTNLVADAP